VSSLLSVVLTAFPFFRYNAHDGSHSILDALGGYGEFASALMPSVVQGRPLIWCVWLFVSGMWIWFAVRKLDRS
jgi:hypothetical protein